MTALCALLLLLVQAQGTASAQDGADIPPADVSDPGRIPMFDSFSTPQMEPGSGGKLTLNITNRYGHNMTDVVVGFEIYRFSNMDGTKKAGDLDAIPSFRGGDAGGNTGTPGAGGVTFDLAAPIGPGETIVVTMDIKAPGDAPIGTYFLRSHMSFDMGNGSYRMYSRGHFPDDAWYKYEREKPTNYLRDWEEHVAALSELANGSGLPGLNGIIPDTSFGVKEPVGYTCFFALIVAAVILGGVTVFFYLMDEKGKFPGARKAIDGTWDAMRRKGRGKGRGKDRGKDRGKGRGRGREGSAEKGEGAGTDGEKVTVKMKTDGKAKK